MAFAGYHVMCCNHYGITAVFYNFDDPRPRHALKCRQCQHLVATFKWHETNRSDVILFDILIHLANWYQSIWILYPLLVFMSCSNLHCEPAWGHSKPDQASALTTGSKLSVPSLELDQVALVSDFNCPFCQWNFCEFWLLLHHDIKLLQGLAIWEVGPKERIVNNDLLKLITRTHGCMNWIGLQMCSGLCVCNTFLDLEQRSSFLLCLLKNPVLVCVPARPRATPSTLVCALADHGHSRTSFQEVNT